MITVIFDVGDVSLKTDLLEFKGGLTLLEDSVKDVKEFFFHS